MLALYTANLMNSMMASNAVSTHIKAVNGIMDGVRQAGNPNIGFGGAQQLHNRENNLMAQKIKADIMLQIANARHDKLQKDLKDSVKRSFSVFA